MTIEQGLHVLDDLYKFCQEHNVYGQVTFTGGNPLLYPHFMTLYKEAVDRGFLIGVLGNPMDRSYIEEMVAIQTPEFYQVSLEGLQEHNDYIRGAGHYEQTIRFLELLKEATIEVVQGEEYSAIHIRAASSVRLVDDVMDDTPVDY